MISMTMHGRPATEMTCVPDVASDAAVASSDLVFLVCGDRSFVVDRGDRVFSVHLVLDNGTVELMSQVPLSHGHIEAAVAGCAALLGPRPSASLPRVV